MGVLRNKFKIEDLEKQGGSEVETRLSHLEDEFTALQSYALGEVLIGEYYDGNSIYRNIYHFDRQIIVDKENWTSIDSTIENIDKIFSTTVISGNLSISAHAEYQNDMLKVFNTYPSSISIDEVIIYYTKNEE